MSEDVKTDEIVELHDEQINDEIVEETLEEGAPVAKGKPDADAVTEPESIIRLIKRQTQLNKLPVPKTKAGMINAMYASTEDEEGRCPNHTKKLMGRLQRVSRRWRR